LSGHWDAVKLLLSKGDGAVDFGVVSAANRGSCSTFFISLALLRCNTAQRDAGTLVRSCEMGHVPVVQLMLDARADALHRDGVRCTVLPCEHTEPLRAA
jgi:hypothetical protein